MVTPDLIVSPLKTNQSPRSVLNSDQKRNAGNAICESTQRKVGCGGFRGRMVIELMPDEKLIKWHPNLCYHFHSKSLYFLSPLSP